MNFIDEVNQIKNQKKREIRDDERSREQKKKDQFIARVQYYIDNFEEVKDGIKQAASEGSDTYTVIPRVLDIKPPIFGNSRTKVYGSAPRTGGISPGDGSVKKYECAKGELLTSEPNAQGFNGRWYFVDTKAGKSVIIDKTLLELWELLESLGVRPFFEGGMDSGSLCVQF